MNTYSKLKFLRITAVLKITAAIGKYKIIWARFLAKMLRHKRLPRPGTFKYLVLNSMDWFETFFYFNSDHYSTSELISLVARSLGGWKESAKIYETYKKEIWQLISRSASKENLSISEFVSRLLLNDYRETAKSVEGFANTLVSHGVERIVTDEFYAERRLTY